MALLFGGRGLVPSFLYIFSAEQRQVQLWLLFCEVNYVQKMNKR